MTGFQALEPRCAAGRGMMEVIAKLQEAARKAAAAAAKLEAGGVSSGLLQDAIILLHTGSASASPQITLCNRDTLKLLEVAEIYRVDP